MKGKQCADVKLKNLKGLDRHHMDALQPYNSEGKRLERLWNDERMKGKVNKVAERAEQLGLGYELNGEEKEIGIKAAIGIVECARSFFRAITGGGLCYFLGERDFLEELEQASHKFARIVQHNAPGTQEGFLKNTQILLALLEKTQCRCPGIHRGIRARKALRSRSATNHSSYRGRKTRGVQ